MVSRFERFSLAISEISRYWHKIAADEMEKYGLKGPYAVYLITMYRYDNGITSSQLGEACGRDKSDVSRAVSLMENKGLIKRESVNQSLYRARIVLTDEGKKAAEHINKRAQIAAELGGKGLTEEHREIFYKALGLIASNLHTLSEEGLPQQ